jgi:demethylmenaquinone methyltransferase/2-methoxy-6-polyprenyl-1,4-benzoquinol methylase
LALRFYSLIGISKSFRVKAVDLLRLKGGDTVVELGCGTGVSFPLILERIEPEGRLIGVDISSGMLDRARRRIEPAGWTNVELAQSDIAEYDLPKGVDGVLATGVFGYLEEGDKVIEALSRAIAPGGRLVIFDGQEPDRLPAWLFRFIVWVSRPFGVTRGYFEKPTAAAVRRHFRDVTVESMYGGMMFIAGGTAGPSEIV